MPLINSISGLRGTIPDSLTPEIVIQYANAFVKFTGVGGTIVIGHDGRPSGEWICNILEGTLQALGSKVISIGMAPTPTVQLATEKSDSVGGISVSASHNPAQWNGLKFLNSDGIFLDKDECNTFWSFLDSNLDYVNFNEYNKLLDEKHWTTKHIFEALSLNFVDLELIEKRNFKVVVDAVNASGSFIVPKLLETCGCEVIRLYCEGNGEFPHTPEPISENLNELSKAVIKNNANFGIAVDPDADRLVLIDENGEPIGEEYTITIAIDFILAYYKSLMKKDLSCAINLSTTRAVEDIAKRYGAVVYRTPVGEINVAKKMKEVGSVIGGEGSGGVILPELHFGRDSIAGIIIILNALARDGRSLSKLRESMPHYFISKKKITVTDKNNLSDIIIKIKEVENDGEINTDDGLRIAFNNSWVHLRGSNTEPIIRVIAEAPTPEAAEKLALKYVDMFS
ncbi:MAG: phosphoglucosamine mutase [Chlorobiota bacterium]|nr:phosphoglucosamine mutase [Chlorobiota bacterium]QQS67256.1 MAG: phosphoglucosamine mutase [Chlorobiota bacterium]